MGVVNTLRRHGQTVVSISVHCYTGTVKEWSAFQSIITLARSKSGEHFSPLLHWHGQRVVSISVHYYTGTVKER